MVATNHPHSAPLHWRQLVKLQENQDVFCEVLKSHGIDKPDDISPSTSELDQALLQSFWKYLFLLFETPRPSTNYKLPEDPKRLDRVRETLKEIANHLQIEYRTDEIGNVLLFKKGKNSKLEKIESICLQGHLDMVCSKNAESTHNFDTEPLKVELFEDEDNSQKLWLRSSLQSTLGADNGVGIAAGLAIMEVLDNDKHGDLELLCTVNEETDFSGAEKLGQPEPKNFLQSKLLLNLDSEQADSICIGCAGGFEHSYFIENLQFVEQKNDMFFANMIAIELKGFHGGHSGGDIHIGYENANIILLKLLQIVLQKLESKDDAVEICLAELKGGTGPSAISRESSCHLGIFAKANCIDDIGKEIQNLLEITWNSLATELKQEDPKKLKMDLTLSGVAITDDGGSNKNIFMNIGTKNGIKSTPKRRWLSGKSTKIIIDFLLTVPHGIISKSESTGDVESSINFGQMLFHGSVTRENANEKFASMTDNAITGPKRFCFACQRFEALGGNDSEKKQEHEGAEKQEEEDEFICREVCEVNQQELQSINNGTCFIHFFYRSSDNDKAVRYGEDILRSSIPKKFENYLLEMEENEKPKLVFDSDLFPFPAWQPRWDSPFLQRIQNAYRKEIIEKNDSNKRSEALLYTTHGGLECGAFMETYPDLECVSIGPQLEFPHSPDEKVSVDGCAEWLRWLRAVVEVQ